jgi:hypothetical protein
MTGKKSKERLPKLSEAERHKRFVDMAREVEASDDPKDFDAAFRKIVKISAPKPSGRRSHHNVRRAGS